MSPKKADKKHDKKPKSSAPIVDSLATALGLLDFFSIREPELSLRELSEKTGLYKSRIHRLCGTLVELRFLTRMPSSSYRLGPKLLALGKIYEKSNSLLTVSRPIMKELAQITGETASIFYLDGDACLCLAREYGSSRLVFDIQEGGEHIDLHASAAGRIFLAYGPEELAEHLLAKPDLKRFTSKTIIDRDLLAQRLIDIKERGYEINRGERELEVSAMAAPIWDHEHTLKAALGIAGPAQRFSKDHEKVLITHLLDAGRKISGMLGASV
jgi:DNA-binding IclR family transcriptional regulator